MTKGININKNLTMDENTVHLSSQVKPKVGPSSADTYRERYSVLFCLVLFSLSQTKLVENRKRFNFQ